MHCAAVTNRFANCVAGGFDVAQQSRHCDTSHVGVCLAVSFACCVAHGFPDVFTVAVDERCNDGHTVDDCCSDLVVVAQRSCISFTDALANAVLVTVRLAVASVVCLACWRASCRIWPLFSTRRYSGCSVLCLAGACDRLQRHANSRRWRWWRRQLVRRRWSVL